MSKPELQRPSQALAPKVTYVNIDDSNNDQTQQDAQILHAFKVDNLGVLLDARTVSELLTNLSVCRLPNTNNVLHGMGNLRGNIIPVFDLRTLFGMPECDYKYFLVIGEGADAVAVLLDEVPLQIDINEQNKMNALPPMPAAIRAHVKSAFHSNGLWVECDLLSFFESLQHYLK